MFEQLLAVGKSAKRYHPDSGPGNPFYVGDENVGYFGEVAQSELITMQEFKDMFPALSLTASQLSPYLKFLYYGKILFIKKLPGAQISWFDLYQAGLIYGPDGKNNNLIKIEVDQVKTLQKNGNRYYARTITSDETDISTIATPNGTLAYVNDDKVRRKSMFTELIYRVITGAISIYPEKKFETFATGAAMLASTDAFEVSREITPNGSNPSQAAPILRIDKYNGASSRNFTTAIVGWGTTNSPYNWRPVLEYIPALAPIQIYQFINKQAADSVTVEQSVSSITTALGSLHLQRLVGMADASTGPAQAASVRAAPIDVVSATKLKSASAGPDKIASINGVWIP